MSTKDVLIEIANHLPPNATLADAAYELEFRQAVEAGFASLDRGEGISIGDARKLLPQWITKSSSLPKP